jgi:hypothetical protein
LPNGAPNHPELIGNAQKTEKKQRDKILKFQIQQIWTALPTNARCIIALHQYIGAGIPIFHFSDRCHLFVTLIVTIVDGFD